MFFRVFAAALLCASVSSCSDSEQRILSVSAYVVFDFPDGGSPNQRLSVFIESSGDARRVSAMEVSSREAMYRWKCSDPVVFSNDRRQWAGFTGFVAPDTDPIPKGLYDVSFTDAEGRVFEGVVSVNYPSELLSAGPSEVQSLSFGKYREMVAVYDSGGTLLYYGERRESWKTDRNIFSSYDDAAYCRNCLALSSSNAICLLPPLYRESLEEN